MHLSSPLALLSILALPIAAAAQDDEEEGFATDELLEKVMAPDQDGDKPKEGWSVSAKIGGSFALTHNAEVVGTEDGLTLQLGAALGGEATLRKGQHEWENMLSFQQTQTRTPQLERFIKALDQLDLLSTYTYRFERPNWLGVFARALLNTQVFVGELVAAETVLVQRVDANDAPIGLPFELAAGSDLNLTSPFEPLNLRQSLGLFAMPKTDPSFEISFRAGMGAQEVITQGGDVVVDADDDLVTLRELEDFVFELGAELEGDLTGEFVKDVVGYFLNVNLFYPPFTTSEFNRDFVESINLRVRGGLSLKLSDLLSLEYVLNVLRIPAVTEDLQIQNGLLISAGFDIM